MARLRLKDLRPGARLPVPLYDDQERLLLNAGIVLSRRNLDRLLARGVSHVRVDQRHAEQLTNDGKAARARRQQLSNDAARSEPQESFGGRTFPIDAFIHQVKRSRGRVPSVDVEQQFDQTIRAAEANVKLLFAEIGASAKIPGAKVKDITVETAEQLAADLDLFMRLGINVDHSDSSAYMHGVRVARLAMSAGTIAGLTRDRLLGLGMGCLIADAGMAAIDRSIYNLPRRLTRSEFLEITKHPGRTFDMLTKVPEIPPDARTVAYQIHERWDGSGYPRQRRGVQIHPLARLAMVADVFVALVSPRPHRAAYSAYDAIRIVLTETSQGRFDPASVRTVLETISLFPIGSIVSLNTGQVGRVVSTNLQDYTRPIIEPFLRGSRDWSGQPIDLLKDQDLRILSAHASLDDALEAISNSPGFEEALASEFD
ncbi:HD-GYP domain-containing protein [Stratiformator vulcanicus]|uniref:Cyclic di-GMP phosphodiesterase response regulator RpfG n=1 Tax=Stratiformator vulcanicus TaxID=2527980 RepID=A0A517R7P7_9PLAN|nr:HD domain-containing phosphohydrolase [Stratiformator vulcanicus]QDT39919.1 Cyclic di-GMP phosphodiesterase response regulator RpfG [Stratiformator vulcanicus]